MKKILVAGVAIVIGLQLFAYPTPSFVKENVEPTASGVNEKLLKNFNENFPNAEKVKWQESKDLFEVTFMEEGILTRITYDKNGEFNGSLRYYTEKYLPYYLINVVKNKYPQQKIFGVTELATPSGIVYYVKLEGAKYWLTLVLSSDGSMTVEDKYRTAQ
jgi:hypothetical protein